MTSSVLSHTVNCVRQQEASDHHLLAHPNLFQEEAGQVLAHLRTAMTRLVEAAPGEVVRAADLTNLLGVRHSLAWEIYKVAKVTDPFEVVAYIPRAEAVHKALLAASERGFPENAIARVRKAHADFEALVKKHGGNRATFDAMIAALGRGQSDQLDFRHRRAAFRADAQLWGLQVRTLYRAFILQAGASPTLEEAAVISGVVALRALRPVPSVRLGRRLVALVKSGKDATPSEQAVTDPGPAVLKEFCTKPLPEIETIREGDAWADSIRLVGIGQMARVSCFVSDHLRDAPTPTPNPRCEVATIVSLPSEEFILDLVAPRGWTDPTTVQTATFGSIGRPELAASRNEALRMPTRGEVVYHGTSIDALHDAAVPRCGEMIRQVIAKHNWQNTEFDVYRCRLRYPILHSVVNLRVDAAKG